MPAPAFADTPSSVANLDLSVNILPVISIRTLDSTVTSEITELNYSITPTPSGVRQTNTTVVDVATSNVSGYTLYMNSDYQDSNNNYTTSLLNTDPTLASASSGQIPTSITKSSGYWNYTLDTSNNTSITKLIPTYNNPDTIRDDISTAIDSSLTEVDVNVNIDTTTVSGTYQNRLLFTAVANPIPVDFTLTFDQNTVDTVTNLPAPLTATQVASQYNFIVPDVSGAGTLPQMVRSGYQFVGWSTSPTTRQGSGSGPDGLYVAGDTYTVLADDSEQIDYTQHGTGSGTLYAVWALELTLTVDPNGGTWNNSTSAQSFTQIVDTTKTIADPTAPTYTISYDANSQGASYTGAPTSVARPFTGWTLSGGGSWDSTNSIYTYNTSSGTLTANYDTTSSSFTLPAITKTEYTCNWAEGSTSGTQYAGGTSRTISGDTTYYAVCTLNAWTTIRSYTWTRYAQSKSADWSTANSICNNLTLGGKTWALPSRFHFLDLFYVKENGAYNASNQYTDTVAYFYNTWEATSGNNLRNYFWTSSPAPGNNAGKYIWGRFQSTSYFGIMQYYFDDGTLKLSVVCVSSN